MVVLAATCEQHLPWYTPVMAAVNTVSPAAAGKGREVMEVCF
jgi:hypothetical protein